METGFANPYDACDLFNNAYKDKDAVVLASLFELHGEQVSAKVIKGRKAIERKYKKEFKTPYTMVMTMNEDTIKIDNTLATVRGKFRKVNKETGDKLTGEFLLVMTANTDDVWHIQTDIWTIKA